jgi:hypothetical protein
MWTAVFSLVLLMFAMAGFGGAGASVAVVRARYASFGERDAGMVAVATMLFIFGTVCSVVEWGVAGMAALGTLSAWVGYVLAAQRLGLFPIETGRLAEEAVPHQRT